MGGPRPEGDKLLGEKKIEITKTKQRLLNGLEKLRETEVGVAQLQQSLEKSRPVLVQTAKNIEVLLGARRPQQRSFFFFVGFRCTAFCYRGRFGSGGKKLSWKTSSG